jgi:hypothetical protein
MSGRHALIQEDNWKKQNVVANMGGIVVHCANRLPPRNKVFFHKSPQNEVQRRVSAD